jgi:spermidine/putrescine transport system substrate-binding protein
MKKNIVLGVALAALVFLTGSCTRRETLSIFNWSYYTPQAVIEQFEREFGVRVIYDEFASNEEMFAKLMAGGAGYDIVFPSQDYTAIMIHHGMLERLDHSLLPNLKHLDPVMLQKKTYDPDMNYSVPYYWGLAGIIVNTAMVPNFEKCWSIFARADLRGRMTMLDDMREVMGGALAHLGFSVNSTNPAEIEAARAYINANWRPNLAKFDSETFGKGYANGDFWVVHAFPEVVYEEIEDNPQLMRDTVFFIPPGGPAYIDNMVILRNSRNVELAHKFINFIHRPEIYAAFADEFGFPATANVPARDYKQGPSWYELEDLIGRDLTMDLGEALGLYHDAWFNSIRIGN